jgi:hypothetical protein
MTNYKPENMREEANVTYLTVLPAKKDEEISESNAGIQTDCESDASLL